MTSTHEALGKCKAAVFPRTGQLISMPYLCTRKAVRQGFCKQHYKIVSRHRLVPPVEQPN